MEAVPGLGSPYCSDSSAFVASHRPLRISSFSQFSLCPSFRLTSPSFVKNFRPSRSIRSFFQDDPGPSANNNLHAPLSRLPFKSSNASNACYTEHNKEEDKLSCHSTADVSFSGELENMPMKKKEGSDGGNELEDGYRMIRVADRLIEVFLIERTTPEEWRKLLAFSKEWSKIRLHFFKRCRARAEQELELEIKGNLLKLCRKLKEVDDDMERHNELLAFIKESEEDIAKVVARRRKDFTQDFFQHLELLYQASYEQPDQQTVIARIAQKCAAQVEAHDQVAKEEAAISAAQMKFDDILNSPSLAVARNKIDDLAQRNELDSTLMLLITKAWAASKESTMMKEEVKDVLYHLYVIARGNMQRLVPKEVRILRHVLTFEDPKEQLAALAEAFSPGAELEGEDIDLLYTTPEQLHNWIVIVLNAFYNNQKNSLMKSAQELMSPTTIKRLQDLKRTIEDQFL